MTDRRQIERWIGAVLAPEVRSPGTIASANEVVPSREYLERFPPALVVAFGRTPAGAVSPTPQLERVRAMCRELGEAEPLVACDLEQGAGLHFAEGTRLPPALALASADLASESHFVERAGIWTAMEARRFGVRLVLAPVADVNTRGSNPIIAVRSFGDEPAAAAVHAASFLRGLQAGGAGGCAKHFPGHGDTRQDSHLVLPRIDRSLEQLREVELVPFRALIDAGVDTVMVGHLDVPALTGEPGLPCTLSRRVATNLLRDELGFRGVVVSDAMNMGALDGFDQRYARALAAGIDALLLPHDCEAAAKELLLALERGELELDRLEHAAVRMAEFRERAVRRPSDMKYIGTIMADAVKREFGELFEHARRYPRSQLRGARARDVQENFGRSLSASVEQQSLRLSPAGVPWERGSAYKVGDAWPSTQSPEVSNCIAELRQRADGDDSRILIPVVCEARALLGRYGPSAEELARLHAAIDAELAGGKEIAVAWFGSPQTIPSGWWHSGRFSIVLAFAPTPPMFAAVARFLRGSNAPPSGSLPAKLG